jgi:thioredoxin 1
MANNLIELNDSNFETEVGPESGLTLVDFWAPWCGPCRMVAPVIEQLAREYEGKVRFAKLNVDDAQATAARFGIRSIPTIGLFKDGEPVDGVVGAVPKQHLAKMLNEHLPVVA